MSHPTHSPNSAEVRIQDVVLGGDINPRMNYPDMTFKITANQPLFGENGRVTPAGLIVERALIARPKQEAPTYEVVLEEERLPELDGPNQVWVRHWEEGAHDDPPTDVAILNARLRSRKRPYVKMEASPGDPNLVTVLRSEAYGHLVLKAAQELPSVMDIELVQTGKNNTKAQPRYRVYPEGVLLRTVLDPYNVSLQRAGRELEDLLVKNILPA